MSINKTRYHFPKSGEEPLITRPVIVGSGPAGLFCGWYLARAGYRPLILERGEQVRERRRTVERFWKEGILDSESNVQFGEGGAGTFSDGKLNTLVKDPLGRNKEVLKRFVKAGAPKEILYEQKPHLGTDVLASIVETLRKQIEAMGGSFRFGTKLTGLKLEDNTLQSLILNGEEELKAQVCVLAIGHSARDTFSMLHGCGLPMEPKSFAVGLRIEHPQKMINQALYGEAESAELGAASYKVTHQASTGRGVYSFCMCPGGFIVPAASGPEQVVVNGMSPSNRGSRWSNSGMVVEIQPEDLRSGELRIESGELAAQQNERLLAINPSLNHSQLSTLNSQLLPLHFQEELERQCWLQGGRRQTAPAQRMMDFTRKKLSYDLPESSYSPGIISSPLHFWLPPFISKRLSLGFQQFGRSSHGFLTNEAVMIGVETRTSSPVRIVRDKETLQHITVRGLFPCGEGAGYAGGIVSAGIDGERCAEAAANYLHH